MRYSRKQRIRQLNNKQWKEQQKRQKWQEIEDSYQRKRFFTTLARRIKMTKGFKTKVITTIVIIAMLILLTGMVKANAQTISNELYASVEVETNLSLREAPSTDSALIGKLYPKEVVRVLSIDQDGWTRVNTEYGEGYVSSEFIKFVGNENAIFDDPERLKGEKIDDDLLLTTVVITASKSSQNRNFNMSKACDRINNYVLQPGEIFAWYDVDKTYNKAGHIKAYGVVGPASKDFGYKEATVITNGKHVTGYGGGVCQVCTALYNCVLNLDIEPIERHGHSLASTYVEKGMDATVGYHEDQAYRKNFVFANTLGYPIIFKAYQTDGKVVMSVYKKE